MYLKNDKNPDINKYISRAEIWSLIKIIFGVILWLGLMVLTFYWLLMLPALLLVTVWLYLIVSHYFSKQVTNEVGWQNQEIDQEEEKDE